jgi:D-aspartate ligase
MSSSQTVPALIIDRGGRIELLAARLLGRAGVPVHVLSARTTPASVSRWTFARHAISPLRTTPEERVVDEITAIATRLGDGCGERPVMLFTWDRALLLAARNRERLDQVLRLDLAEREALERSVDKRRFAETAEAAGLPVPRSVVVESRADFAAAADLGFPVFLKPPTNLAWGDLPARLGVEDKGLRVDDGDRLRHLLSAFVDEGRPVLVQEYVDGPDRNHPAIHLYRDPVSLRTVVVGTVRRARVYPAGAGLGCYVVSESFPELIEPSIRSLEVLGLTGTASVQWKLDTRRGWRMLEIGARISLTMGVGAASGSNSPLFAYNALLGGPLEVPPQRDGVAWLDLEHDRISMRAYRQTGEWNTLSWLSSLRSVRSFAFLSLDDPMPWVHQLRYRSAG